MRFIHAISPAIGEKGLNWDENFALLQEIGINDILCPDFFTFKYVYDQLKKKEICSSIYVVSPPKKESIKMIWDLLCSLETFTLFISFRAKFKDYIAYRDALYEAFSLTDEVGCLIEADLVSQEEELIETIQRDFGVRQFLVEDPKGLFLPEDTTNTIRLLKRKIVEGSHVFFYPKDTYSLGLINSLVAMAEEIDGLIGSLFRAEDTDSVDFIRLSSVYKYKKKMLFPPHLVETLDKVFFSLCNLGGRITFLKK